MHMFGNFSEEARKILTLSKKEMFDLKHPYVGSEHLLLALLKQENCISERLKEYQLTYSVFKEELLRVVGVGTEASQWFLYTPLLKRVIENAIIDSKENNHGEVTLEHLFSSLLEEGEGVAIRIMLGMNIDLDELYGEFSYKISNPSKKKKGKKLLLEELGIDLTKKAMNQDVDPVVGREAEIKRILEILSRRTKNNPLLIGEAGVGKTAIVEELSRRIVNGDVPINLKNKRIISLDMATTVAGTKYRGEFEERVRKILKEVEENDDIILFIDEIHTLVGAGGAEGAIDASNIFKPALARNKLRCIGATTIEEYKKFIEQDRALERRFQKIEIEIPTLETVKNILEQLKPIYEQFHHVHLSDTILNTIIQLSDKYVYDRNQPDKAIDILDEVCARVSLKEGKDLKKYHSLSHQLKLVLEKKNQALMKQQFEVASQYKEQENAIMNDMNELELVLCEKNKTKDVTIQDLVEVIHAKTKIPVYELLNDNRKVIENMEQELRKKIVGQEQAISDVLQLAKRIKLGFQDENKGYSLLLCGPSGVGKTELAKTFGASFVGKNNVIRLDMSEYAESHTISKIIGAPPGYVGYSDHRHIFEEIRTKPYSVLILDEVERAHPTVLNLFFQIMDEGKAKDATGKEVRFDHVILIMTSNIGFDEINVGFQKQDRAFTLSKLKEHFSIPFINRIDQVVIFESLTEEIITELIQKKLNRLKQKYEKKEIHVCFHPKLKKQIVQESEYSDFGARRLDKIIKDKVESQIIEGIMQHQSKVKIQEIQQPSIV